MSDDDLWRPKQPPAGDGDDETRPLTGAPPPSPWFSSPSASPSGSPGPGAVPPAPNPYGAPNPHGGGYLPPPNPYAAPHEYAPPQSPYGAPYQPAYAGGLLPDHPSATTAMVLGIIALAGIVFCAGVTLVLSPVAWIVGAKAVREIDSAPGRYGGRDKAAAGKVMGIIGTVLLILGILAIVAVIAIAASMGTSSPTPSPQLQGA